MLYDIYFKINIHASFFYYRKPLNLKCNVKKLNQRTKIKTSLRIFIWKVKHPGSEAVALALKPRPHCALSGDCPSCLRQEGAPKPRAFFCFYLLETGSLYVVLAVLEFAEWIRLA